MGTTTSNTSTSTSGLALAVSEVGNVLPLLSMLTGTKLAGIGTSVTGFLTNLSADAKQQIVALKAEFDAGNAGPVAQAVLAFLPQFEHLLNLPSWNETQFFAALESIVDDAHTAATAL